MHKRFRAAAPALCLLALLLWTAPALAQGGEQPPAPVVTATAEAGTVQPQNEYVGTVYFPEVSLVASEVAGRVTEVAFDEGDHVRRGSLLAALNTDLLQKRLAAARAQRQEVLTSLENARLDLERKSSLFDAQTISESAYDEARFRVAGLEEKAASLEAEVDRLQLEIDKARIPAPFDGVVLERHAGRGEWISMGGPVATLARDDQVDVVVEVPQEVLAFARPGADVEVNVAGRRVQGRIDAVIPQGDVATRTFPVKVRIVNDMGLAQGMEARVRVPAGPETQAVVVPRDAVIQSAMAGGAFVVYAVRDGAAAMVPVQVVAYMGLDAAVRGEGLEAGSQVVVKGNERLRPGQPVAATPQKAQ